MGDDLNVAWTYELEGDGWASPVVWGSKVFVSTVVAEKINKPGEGEEENQDLFKSDVYRWELSCVDLVTGDEIWKKVVRQGNPRVSKHRNANYASETPVTDGERIMKNSPSWWPWIRRQVRKYGRWFVMKKPTTVLPLYGSSK
jgi:outer membrane protein assembly factor BamB